MIAEQQNESSATDIKLKLDFGCGEHCEPGFEGVDISAECGADYVCDLRQTPWVLWSTRFERSMPVLDESVSEARMSHFFEHLDGPERIVFMNELYRVLSPGARVTIIVPYYLSARAVQDPTHKWPPLAETSFLYFNKEWMHANGLDHYPITCDFEMQPPAYNVSEDWALRSEEARSFAARHYHNVIADLHVVLLKK